MTKHSLGEKLRYKFENTLSKGASAIMLWLAVVSLLIVIIAASVLAVTGINAPESEGLNFIEAAWQSLMRTFDAGNMAGDEGWPLRIIMLLVTIGGIFIVSSLIGTITSGLESKLDELRKGRSKVLETNHTLILGWSPKIFSIISELIIANENLKSARIVIMADKDKVEMEDDIKAKLANTKNTKIICRTGSPLDLNDLEVVSPHDAKSIIILSPEQENPDTHVIKSILAITNNPNRRKENYHIVAEIREEENMEAAKLVGGNEAVLVLAGDLIARVTAQTCRQSGLSIVYTELLDFDGAEIYFKNEPALAGKKYKDALVAYDDSAVIGIFKKNGESNVNPPMDTVIEKTDSLIVIAEDDDTIKLSGIAKPVIAEHAISSVTKSANVQEKTLVLGWNEKGNTIIQELDNYVADGSHVLIAAETDDAENAAKELSLKMKKQKVTFKKLKTTESAAIQSLDVKSYNHIIILCYTTMDVQEADAKTLITLLHLRNIADETGHNFSIVSEMLDVRNRELAEVTKADDFIVSDKLISLMLSQLSENKHLKKVFDDLFDADGSEIYLRPATDYVKENEQIDFHTVIESAARKGETAIGYKIDAQSKDASKAYGVKVSPVKSAALKFTAKDKVIVLAED
jgi:voltage-gated potassium channel Kch